MQANKPSYEDASSSYSHAIHFDRCTTNQSKPESQFNNNLLQPDSPQVTLEVNNFSYTPIVAYSSSLIVMKRNARTSDQLMNIGRDTDFLFYQKKFKFTNDATSNAGLSRVELSLGSRASSLLDTF